MTSRLDEKFDICPWPVRVTPAGKRFKWRKCAPGEDEVIPAGGMFVQYPGDLTTHILKSGDADILLKNSREWMGDSVERLLRSMTYNIDIPNDITNMFKMLGAQLINNMGVNSETVTALRRLVEAHDCCKRIGN